MSITWLPVISRGGLLVVCMLIGCGSTNVLYTPGRAPIAVPARDRNYEDPDRYRVDSSLYPTYVARHDFSPPPPREGAYVSKIPNAQILASDVWRVTHKVADSVLIFSDSYQERQCDHLLKYGKFAGAFKGPLDKNCRADYLYYLFVLPDGRINGWMLLRNPSDVAFAKDRYTVMDPSLRQSSGWPSEPIFVATNK